VIGMSTPSSLASAATSGAVVTPLLGRLINLYASALFRAKLFDPVIIGKYLMVELRDALLELPRLVLTVLHFKINPLLLYKDAVVLNC
jgi:hypothetical protein